MAEQQIRELEEAAQVILAPTNLISSEQRQSAEEIFLNFRKTKSPYQLCRQILETNSTDYILFESAGLIKTALVKEWSTISEADISSLRQYMFNYVISKPYLAPYVRGRIVEVLAIMIKKGSVADLGEERGRILSEVERLIMSGDLPRQLLGCSIISAIMQEYAVSLKSSDIGFTWEVHCKEEERFQAHDLKRIFKFSVGVLGELIKKDMQEDTVALLKHLLPIVEGVLSWSFRYREGATSVSSSDLWIALYYQDNTLPLILHAEWDEIFLDPTILDFFFTLYWKVRGNPQLAHHARNCLVQLASLNGGTLSNINVRLEYLTNYVQRFLELISNIDIIDQEASGIANIIKKIFVFRETLISLPKDMLKSFWDHLSRLTCMFIENAAQEESLGVNDCLYTDGLEYLFNVWVFILTEPNLFSPEFFNQSSIQIFNKYLQCHLSVPDGFRGTELKDLNEEEIDIEQDDKIRFKEQLQTIGSFGRQILSHSLPLLAQLIEDRTLKLRENLNKFVGQTESMNNSGNNSMTGLYEDLHWLLLVAGHVLCMEAEGEVTLMPSQIMRYSMKQVEQGQVDVNRTLQLLASSQNVQSDMNVSTDSVDHVARLVADIFRLCAIEKTAISIHLESMLSPELSCTIMWFLHRWSLNYLILMESAYDEISTTLIQAFGEDSPGATWTMNFLLEKVEYNINAFKGEPALIKETIHLLIALVESRKKAACVLKSELFGHIMDMATKGQYNFPQVVKRGLMQAIVLVGVAAPYSNSEQCYWAQTLQALQTRCKRITSHEHFLATYHQEQIKVQIIDILECFIGAAQGVKPATADRVFEHTCPVLLELPNLLSLYHNYQQIVQLILELLCECTKGILAYLSQGNTVRLCQICLNTVQNYTGCNTNRLTVDATTEEDSFQDILLLMQMLTNLLSKEDICIRRSDTNTSQVQLVNPTAADVSLHSLNIIMPLMNMDLLKFPTLCLQYFEMLRHTCELCPANVLNLSPEFLQQVLASIELGLFSFGERVAEQCYDIIRILAKYIYLSDKVKKTHQRNELLVPFLKLLLSVTLFHQTDSDFTSNAALPLYCLICCYKEQYQQLVQNILSTQSNQEVVQRLAEAFTKLTADLTLTLTLPDRNIFKQNFNRFVISVREFLIVK